MIQTMQQKRAAFALKRVKDDLEKVDKKEYKSHAAQLPFMIHANGLGQAAAFYLSKSKDNKEGKENVHKRLYVLLSDWLTDKDKEFLDKLNFFPQKDLLEGITQTDMHTYLAAQAEAMKLMEWVKSFAAAYAE